MACHRHESARYFGPMLAGQDSVDDLLRRLLCRLLCRHPPEPRADVTISGNGIIGVFFGKESTMAIVRNDGGPLKFDISGFVNDKGNPVTDKDIPVLSSSDETVATIVPDPDDPAGQDGLITLTGKNSDEGTEVVFKASFPAAKYGQAFEVPGHLTVIEPPAAAATAVISGPGVVAGA